MYLIAEAFTDPTKLFTIPFTLAQSIATFTLDIVNQSFDFAQSMLKVFV